MCNSCDEAVTGDECRSEGKTAKQRWTRRDSREDETSEERCCTSLSASWLLWCGTIKQRESSPIQLSAHRARWNLGDRLSALAPRTLKPSKPTMSIVRYLSTFTLLPSGLQHPLKVPHGPLNPQDLLPRLLNPAREARVFAARLAFLPTEARQAREKDVRALRHE